jgi:signal peptidase I
VILVRLLKISASAAATVACWWAFAPPLLGGTAAFAVVDGTSMLPRFQRGDLVILHKAPDYRLGDVVAYRSEMLHRIVLHRIVKISGDHYTFKGDNNSWLDPETPRRDQLAGTLWLRLPRAGEATTLIRRPAIAATLAILLVLGLGLSKPTASIRE